MKQEPESLPNWGMCQLPATILCQIAVELHHDMALHTLSAFSRTSRAIYDIVEPILWRTLTISRIWPFDPASPLGIRDLRPLEVIGSFFKDEQVENHLNRLEDCHWNLDEVRDSLCAERKRGQGPDARGDSDCSLLLPSPLRLLWLFRLVRTLEMDTRDIFQDVTWICDLRDPFRSRDYLLFPRVDTLILGGAGKPIIPTTLNNLIPRAAGKTEASLMYNIPWICRPTQICCHTAEEACLPIWPRLVAQLPSLKRVWTHIWSHWSERFFDLPNCNAHYYTPVPWRAFYRFSLYTAGILCDPSSANLRIEIRTPNHDGLRPPSKHWGHLAGSIRERLQKRRGGSAYTAREIDSIVAEHLKRVTIECRKDFWECGVCGQDLWKPSLLKPEDPEPEYFEAIIDDGW